jgi:hypothetical protein
VSMQSAWAARFDLFEVCIIFGLEKFRLLIDTLFDYSLSGGFCSGKKIPVQNHNGQGGIYRKRLSLGWNMEKICKKRYFRLSKN